MNSVLINQLKSFSRYIKKYHSRNTHNLISSIIKNNHISLVDIGAAGDIEPRWRQISSLLNYYGFEPDLRSYNELKDTNNCNRFTIFNKALWETHQKIRINLCKKPMTSSVYIPNASIIDRYADSDRMSVVSQVELDASPLDSFKIENADFLKIDIQGSELAALKGANGLLTQIMGIETEVEFLQIYKDQPLFGDVCKHLAEQGFEFIDFANIVKWERTQFTSFGQSIFADALFLKTPENICHLLSQGQITEDKFRIYLAILGLYRRFDLIAASVALLKKNYKSDSDLVSDAQIYLTRIKKSQRKIVIYQKIISRFSYFFGNNIQTVINY